MHAVTFKKQIYIPEMILRSEANKRNRQKMRHKQTCSITYTIQWEKNRK